MVEINQLGCLDSQMVASMTLRIRDDKMMKPIMHIGDVAPQHHSSYFSNPKFLFRIRLNFFFSISKSGFFSTPSLQGLKIEIFPCWALLCQNSNLDKKVMKCQKVSILRFSQSSLYCVIIINKVNGRKRPLFLYTIFFSWRSLQVLHH